MIRRIILGAVALLASILGGCDAPVDALDHQPPACVLPSVGETCALPADVSAEEIQRRAWCPDGSAMVVDDRGDGDLEIACEADDRTWRIVVGVRARDWGVAYLADDGSLVVCVDGRVDSVLPLLTDRTSGRHWHRLSVDDGVCLDLDLCELAFEPCDAHQG